MNGLLPADIFFRDDNEDSLWGRNHWLQKTGFRRPALATGAHFQARNAQRDSPAPSTLSNCQRVSQSMCALSPLPEDESVPFPERSHGFGIFRGLFPRRMRLFDSEGKYEGGRLEKGTQQGREALAANREQL